MSRFIPSRQPLFFTLNWTFELFLFFPNNVKYTLSNKSTDEENILMVNLNALGWSRQDLMRLVSLERVLLEELVEDRSVVKDHFILTIIKVVLENSSAEEKREFSTLLKADNHEYLITWLSPRAKKCEDQIVRYLKGFYNNRKIQIIKGKKEKKE